MDKMETSLNEWLEKPLGSQASQSLAKEAEQAEAQLMK